MTPTATSGNLLFVYLASAAASLGLTIWLARTLFKNGEVFLEDVFADQPRLAAAVFVLGTLACADDSTTAPSRIPPATWVNDERW